MCAAAGALTREAALQRQLGQAQARIEILEQQMADSGKVLSKVV
jgi:hypothetical protein